MFVQRGRMLSSVQHGCRMLSTRPLQACILDYHALNRHSDFEAEGGQTAFALTAAAASCLDALDADSIKVGLVLPRFPGDFDVARFLDKYGGRFSAVVGSDGAAGFPAEPAPLIAACEEMGVEPWRALAVASSHVESDYAPLLGAAKAARLFTCALHDGDGVAAREEQAGAKRAVKPMYEVSELGELPLLLFTLNQELG